MIQQIHFQAYKNICPHKVVHECSQRYYSQQPKGENKPKVQQNVVPPHSEYNFTMLQHGQTLSHAAEREKPVTNDHISYDSLPMKFQNGRILRQKDDQELPGAGGVRGEGVGRSRRAGLVNKYGFSFRDDDNALKSDNDDSCMTL